MKKISKFFGFALLLGSAQVALASADPCAVVNNLKGRIDKTNSAIASASMEKLDDAAKEMGINLPSGGSVDQLEAAAKGLGIRLPSGGKMSKEEVMVKVLQFEEGHLYKSIQAAKFACDHEREVAAAAKKAADEAKHRAFELSHQLHRHCAMYGSKKHRHYACRMVN